MNVWQLTTLPDSLIASVASHGEVPDRSRGGLRGQPPLSVPARREIAARMEDLGINQQALAFRLTRRLAVRISEPYLSRLLRGRVGANSAIVAAMAEELGFPRGYLLDLAVGGSGAPSPIEQQLATLQREHQQMAARLHELERQARK